MSAEFSPASPGPAFTLVRLTGPANEVDRLVGALSGSAEIISDFPSMPDTRGVVEREVQVVTHPVPRPAQAEGGVSVTVQSVIEAEGGVFSGLPGTTRAHEVELAVSQAVQSLPHVRTASSRVVSAWGLPVPGQ